MRLLVHLPRVRLEDNSFADAAQAGVEHPPEPFRQLVDEVMRVALRLETDADLGAAEGIEVLAHVLVARCWPDEKADHERRVENLPEPLLLEDVRGGAEHVARGNPAIQEQLDSIEGEADKFQRDLVGPKKGFERLKRR